VHKLQLLYRIHHFNLQTHIHHRSAQSPKLEIHSSRILFRWTAGATTAFISRKWLCLHPPWPFHLLFLTFSLNLVLGIVSLGGSPTCLSSRHLQESVQDLVGRSSVKVSIACVGLGLLLRLRNENVLWSCDVVRIFLNVSKLSPTEQANRTGPADHHRELPLSTPKLQLAKSEFWNWIREFAQELRSFGARAVCTQHALTSKKRLIQSRPGDSNELLNLHK